MFFSQKWVYEFTQDQEHITLFYFTYIVMTFSFNKSDTVRAMMGLSILLLHVLYFQDGGAEGK